MNSSALMQCAFFTESFFLVSCVMSMGQRYDHNGIQVRPMSTTSQTYTSSSDQTKQEKLQYMDQAPEFIHSII